MKATGTDGKSTTGIVSSLPPAYRTGEGSCDSLIVSEGKPTSRGRRAGAPETLRLHGLEADCQPVRAGQKREAPPGFEPGMADLQSAAPILQLSYQPTSYDKRA